MIILDATNRSLEVLLSAAVATSQCPVVACWADETSTTLTPGSTTTATNNTTAVTVVAAPAASTRRLIKDLFVYNEDTLSVTLTVRYNDNTTMRKLHVVVLEPGDTFHLGPRGPAVLDSRGCLRTNDLLLVPGPQIIRCLGVDAANLTATTTHTSNTTYAQYLYPAERAFSSMRTQFRVTTGAATITWTEVGIAKGTFTIGGGATLTRLGYTDTSAIVNSTGVKQVDVTCSGMRAGDHLWILFGAQATTMPVYRGALADDLDTGVFQELAATRISTMAAATAFGTSGTTFVPTWAYAEGRP